MFGIASIPSSGSRFTSDLFDLPFFHIDGDKQWQEAVRTKTIICPMRHPIEVVKTWRARRPKAVNNDLWDCYDSVLAFEAHIDYWLPVDSMHREWHLARINEAMGREHKTDWSKVGANGKVGTLEDGDEDRAARYIELYERICTPR